MLVAQHSDNVEVLKLLTERYGCDPDVLRESFQVRIIHTSTFLLVLYVHQPMQKGVKVAIHKSKVSC